jgi:hypothetical protein
MVTPRFAPRFLMAILLFSSFGAYSADADNVFADGFEPVAHLAIGTLATVTTTAPGENASGIFTATAGQKLTLATSENTFAGGVTLTLRQPSGDAIASLTVTTPTGWLDVFTLPVTGTYTVLIDPAGLQTGTVTFLLAPVPDNTGTTAIGAPTTVATTAAGDCLHPTAGRG